MSHETVLASQDRFYDDIVRRRAAAARQDYYDLVLRVAAPKAVDPAWLPVTVANLRDWRRTAAADATTVGALDRFTFATAQVLQHGGFHAQGIAIEEFMFAGQPGWREVGIAPVLARVMPLKHFDVDTKTLFLAPSPTPSVHEGPVFWFGSPYALANFGHYVHDLLTQLIFVDDAKRAHPDLRFIIPAFHVPGFRYPMQDFLFRELIGPLERVIFHREGTAAVATLLAGEPVFALMGDGRSIARSALRYMIGRVRAHFAPMRAADSPRRIYITRDDGVLARQVENEPAIRAMLMARGFVPITIARLAPEEIVRVMSNAEMIVGVHGAGLLNMIFSDPDVIRVIELDTFPSSWNSIQAFAVGAGIAHTRIPATPSAVPQTLGRVDLAALAAALER